MGASVAGRRTRILVMTSEVELMRLVRSVLEPSGCLVSSDGPSAAGAKADGPFDIVVLDLPGRDLDQLRHAKRAYPDAHFIVVCGGYREADCIAVLDLDADYLPRPFRARDLAARVRVAELRRFNASVRRRYYRHGSFVIDLFNRRVALGGRADSARSIGNERLDASGEPGGPCRDVWPHPGRARARQFGERQASLTGRPFFACGARSSATRGAPIFC